MKNADGIINLKFKESIGILLEGTPKDVNMAELRNPHVVLKEGTEDKRVLSALHKHINENLKISHTTLQTGRTRF